MTYIDCLNQAQKIALDNGVACDIIYTNELTKNIYEFNLKNLKNAKNRLYKNFKEDIKNASEQCDKRLTLKK